MSAIASVTRLCSAGSPATAYNRIFQAAVMGLGLDDGRDIILCTLALQELGQIGLQRRRRQRGSAGDIAAQRVLAGIFVRYLHGVSITSPHQEPPGVAAMVIVTYFLQDHAHVAVRGDDEVDVALDACESRGRCGLPDGSCETAGTLASDLVGWHLAVP